MDIPYFHYPSSSTTMETELHISTIFVQVSFQCKCRIADQKGIAESMRSKTHIKYTTCSCSEFRKKKELENGILQSKIWSCCCANFFRAQHNVPHKIQIKILLLMKTTTSTKNKTSAHHNYKSESFTHAYLISAALQIATDINNVRQERDSHEGMLHGRYFKLV